MQYRIRYKHSLDNLYGQTKQLKVHVYVLRPMIIAADIKYTIHL